MLSTLMGHLLRGYRVGRWTKIPLSIILACETRTETTLSMIIVKNYTYLILSFYRLCGSNKFFLTQAKKILFTKHYQLFYVQSEHSDSDMPPWDDIVFSCWLTLIKRR